MKRVIGLVLLLLGMIGLCVNQLYAQKHAGVRLSIQPVIGFGNSFHDFETTTGPRVGGALRIYGPYSEYSFAISLITGYHVEGFNRIDNVSITQLTLDFNLYLVKDMKVIPYWTLGGGLYNVSSIQQNDGSNRNVRMGGANLGFGFEVRSHKSLSITFEPVRLHFSPSEKPELDDTQLTYWNLLLGVNIFLH